MKGISAIIVVILLLLISVSLASVVYLWFSSIITDVTGESTTNIRSTTNYMNTRMSIINAKNTSLTEISVTVRNSGTEKIDLDNLIAFIDDVEESSNTASGILDVGKTSTFTVTSANSMSTCEHVLRISIASGSESSRMISC